MSLYEITVELGADLERLESESQAAIAFFEKRKARVDSFAKSLAIHDSQLRAFHTALEAFDSALRAADLAFEEGRTTLRA
jgi:hypothetical protein